MKTALIIIVLASTSPAQPVWKQVENRSLELRENDITLVRFILDDSPRDPHFEILATLDGHNTLWVAPPDHVWHYGLWYSWKFINGANFWETNPETGEQEGINRIEDAIIESQPAGEYAVIRYRELASKNPAGPALLQDTVKIEIRRPSANSGTRVTWQITTSALADVTLERTPLPGEPNGRAWGGYAGLSWRGARDFKEVSFTSSESRKDIDIHGQPARWVNATGTLHGKPAGILIMDHPGNPGHPPAWYLSNNEKLPFWFLNPTPLFSNGISMKKGETIHHAYRIIIHDGTWGISSATIAENGFRTDVAESSGNRSTSDR